MTWVAVAIGGSAIVGAGASMYGADKQADANTNAANLSMEQFKLINQQQKPFINTGYSANQTLARLMGLGGDFSPGNMLPSNAGIPDRTKLIGDQYLPEDVTLEHAGNGYYAVKQNGQQIGRLEPGGHNGIYIAERPATPVATPTGAAGGTGGSPQTVDDKTGLPTGYLTQTFGPEQFLSNMDPSYEWRRKQGENALLNSAAAGSGALSGAALKDLLGYNQDMAATEYGNAFNRFQTQQGNIFSRLSSLTQLGQNAAAGVGAQGTQLAGQAGQAISNAGAATGAGYVGAGNAIGNGLTNYWLSKYLPAQQGG